MQSDRTKKMEQIGTAGSKYLLAVNYTKWLNGTKTTFQNNFSYRVVSLTGIVVGY